MKKELSFCYFITLSVESDWIFLRQSQDPLAAPRLKNHCSKLTIGKQFPKSERMKKGEKRQSYLQNNSAAVILTHAHWNSFQDWENEVPNTSFYLQNSDSTGVSVSVYVLIHPAMELSLDPFKIQCSEGKKLLNNETILYTENESM